MFRKKILIAVIILAIFLIVVFLFYFLSPKEIKIVDDIVYRTGECENDDECGYRGSKECRYLTYKIKLDDGRTQYIKKGDSYCVEWCDVGIQCVDENTICQQYDYAKEDKIITRSGCVDSKNYQSIVEMETLDSWIE